MRSLIHRSRLIPAHAGKTPPMARLPEVERAHPRSRGENRSAYLTEATALGSSPLTRGKLNDLSNAQRVKRLIPAHAGKTPCQSPHQNPTTAHPRSRGENSARRRFALRAAGSSPLTRGKPPQPPAPAGVQLAHPRSRGENETAEGVEIEARGSSPLTRGKRGGTWSQPSP